MLGALKLKAISYIHAEGYAFGEMKRGPIALIDEAGEGCMATIEMPSVHPLIAPLVYACRCSSSPIMWRAPRGPMWTSRAIWRSRLR